MKLKIKRVTLNSPIFDEIVFEVGSYVVMCGVTIPIHEIEFPETEMICKTLINGKLEKTICLNEKIGKWKIEYEN